MLVYTYDTSGRFQVPGRAAVLLKADCDCKTDSTAAAVPIRTSIICPEYVRGAFGLLGLIYHISIRTLDFKTGRAPSLQTAHIVEHHRLSSFNLLGCLKEQVPQGTSSRWFRTAAAQHSRGKKNQNVCRRRTNVPPIDRSSAQARGGERAKARAEQEAADAHRFLRRSHAAAPLVHAVPSAELSTASACCAEYFEELLSLRSSCTESERERVDEEEKYFATKKTHLLQCATLQTHAALSRRTSSSAARDSSDVVVPG